jgi:hypothetical protein
MGVSSPEEDRMTQRFYTLAGALLAATALMVAQSGRTIQVDVTYTGSGTVDAGHKIYVALWPSADIDTGPPVDIQSLASKSGTVTFKNVQTVPAYISTAYDPTGKWDAQSAPPSGSSLGMYGKPPKPDPINVAPGKTTTITLTFNDAHKKP